jgi:hypothetical protein
LKAFEGTKPGNQTKFHLFLTPSTAKSFKVNVWLDGPWDNAAWKGKKIGEIIVPANAKQEVTQFTIDVAKYVDKLDQKHAIFLVAEGDSTDVLFNLSGLGFSSTKKKLVRPVVPVVSILVNGKAIDLPTTPVRSTNANGITEYNRYEAKVKIPASETAVPRVTASSNNPTVKVNITQAAAKDGKAVVAFTYKGVVKTYEVVFVAE